MAAAFSLAPARVLPAPLSAPPGADVWLVPSLVRVRIGDFERYAGTAALHVYLAIIRRSDVHNEFNHLTWASARELARDTRYSEITVLRALHWLKNTAQILFDVAYSQMRSIPWSRRRWLRRRGVWGLFQGTHVAVPPWVAEACVVAPPRTAGGGRKGAGRPRKGAPIASSGGEPPILPPEESEPRKREPTQYICVPSGYVPPTHGGKREGAGRTLGAKDSEPRARVLPEPRIGILADTPTLATPAGYDLKTTSATIGAQSTPLAGSENNQVSLQNNQNDRTLKIYTKNSKPFAFSSSSSKKKRKRDSRAETAAVSSVCVSVANESSVSTSSTPISEQPRASHACSPDRLFGACSPGPLLSESRVQASPAPLNLVPGSPPPKSAPLGFANGAPKRLHSARDPFFARERLAPQTRS